MRNLKRILDTSDKQRLLIFVFSFVILFWTIFDCMLTYIVPILMEEQGLSMTMIGLIIGTSSISGVFFDFLISKIFKNTDFRRVFMIMFLISFVYPILLWQAKTIWLFLFAMSVWGIYFDLFGFGTFNFVGRFIKKENHSSSFGVIQIFRALGAIIAPIIVGLIMVTKVEWEVFAFSWFFLGIGFIIFIFLIFFIHKNHPPVDAEQKYKRHKGLFIEIHLWKKLSGLMMPILFMTFYLFFVDAFFWTLAPLYTETLHLEKFSGLFLTAYTLPALFVGLLVEPLTKKFGGNKVAIISILIGSMFLSVFMFIPNPIIEIIVVFIASFFLSLSLPTVNAIYADYISESPQVENEIEGIEDSSFNIGYVLGPIGAGLLADYFSIPHAFSILGTTGVILGITLLIINPKHILLKIKKSEL